LAKESTPKPTLRELLTARQFQIAKLVAEGYSDKQIAAELELAQGTVSVMVYAAMDRADVTKRVLLATRYALEKDRGYYEGT